MALGNQMYTFLLEQGVGPDDLLRSFPTSTIPRVSGEKQKEKENIIPPSIRLFL